MIVLNETIFRMVTVITIIIEIGARGYFLVHMRVTGEVKHSNKIFLSSIDPLNLK